MVDSTSPGHEAYDVSARQRHTAWSLVTAQFALIAVIVALPNRGDWPVSPGLMLVGTVGTWTGIVLMAVAGLLLVALINANSRWEESRLRERFPGYTDYASRTPRFIPRLRSGHGNGA